MANDKLYRFLGDSPGRVIVRLIFLSFIVGIVMSSLDLHPFDIFYGIQSFIIRVWNMGFEAINSIASYFFLGAVVVVPAWLLLRIMKSGR